MKAILILLLLTVLSGCSTHQTTLKQHGGYKIYVIDEKDIFAITYQEMSETVDNEMVNEVDGPERGFSTRLTFGIDSYNVYVKIVPVEGVSMDGSLVKGYFVELSGKGTYPTSRPRKIINNIQNRLDQTGKGVAVTSYKKSAYSLERDRWRLNSAPSSRESGDSVVEKLLQLKILHEEGVISEEEYRLKKSELIEQI